MSFIWVAQIEGNNANAGDAIMLDKDGYVSETNATNIVRQFYLFLSPSRVDEENIRILLENHVDVTETRISSYDGFIYRKIE